MAPLIQTQKMERSEYLEKNLQITECSQRKPYVFISYASDDWKTVFKEAVVPLQQTYGLRVYADKAFDKTNDEWTLPMLRNICGADAIIAFISQSYIESYACFLELLTAVNNKKRIVFVWLLQDLCHGDINDQPYVEQSVKKMIFRQGSSINDTSNSLRQAMKSAYANLSTSLEMDALSKYDISDAFINFFRDASINRKTTNDFKALKHTIGSVSKKLFDKSLISKPERESVDIFRRVAPQAVGRKKRMVITIAGATACFLTVAIAVTSVINIPRNVENKRYTSASGIVGSYTGKWRRNEPTGAGRMEYANGDVYEGTWKNGQRNGQGIMTYTNGAYANGAEYDGEWLNDRRSGEGTLTYDDGRTYQGTWENDQRNGKGTYTYATGSVYDGEWLNDRRNGAGTMRYANKDIYVGNWENDQRSGEGYMRYVNEDIYEGEWKNDQKDGKGKMTYQNKTVEEGIWSEGEFIGSSANTK